MKIPELGLFDRIKLHILHYREQYLFPVVGIIVLVLLIRYVENLTGRAVIDDPGSLVGMAYDCMGILFVMMIVGAAKGFLIPDVDEVSNETPWQKVAIDACATVFLFCFLAWLVVGR